MDSVFDATQEVIGTDLGVLTYLRDEYSVLLKESGLQFKNQAFHIEFYVYMAQILWQYPF